MSCSVYKQKKITEAKKKGYSLTVWNRTAIMGRQKKSPQPHVLSMLVCLLGDGMDMFVYSVHICMQVCKNMDVLRWGDRIWHWLSSWITHHLYLGHGFWNWKLPIWIGNHHPRKSKSQPISAASLHGLHTHAATPSFYMSTGNPNSGPHTCMAGTLLTP